MSALDRVSIAAIADSTSELAAEAQAAERVGIDCVWTPELFRSSVTQATFLAARTERVGVGTGIARAFTRSPFILAVSALDIDEISGAASDWGSARG
jgi:alkanesulfonate monooxygenase SsuD/methylene tetrahydromethanopterin reductase-like flavin-dependent oxidoreductase (luciferase family)